MTNNTFSESYPLTCIYDDKKILLIWQTSETSDIFKLNEVNRLCFAHSTDELKQLLSSAEIKAIHWEESAEVNINEFFNNLSKLKVKHSSSITTCESLLNTWNFIEDMLRTFDLNEESKKLKSPILNKVYEKLFYGCNLPSVTPEGKSYSPLWTNEEISLIRSEFKAIWSFLKKENYIP